MLTINLLLIEFIKGADNMKNPLMKNAKDTMKLGIVSMGGIGTMGIMQGSLGNIPGISAEAKTGLSSTTSIVGGGLNLANIGQLSKTGLSIAKMLGKSK